LQERVQEVDNVVMPALFHHDDLVHNQLLPWLTSKIHLLDSNLRSGSIRAHDILRSLARRILTDTSDVHRTRRALSDLLLFVVALEWVGQADDRPQALHHLRI